MIYVTKPDMICIPCKLRVCKFPKNTMDVNYMLDPEPKDMHRCHQHHFMEICKPPVNEPIGSYQIQHLKSQEGVVGNLSQLNRFLNRIPQRTGHKYQLCDQQLHSVSWYMYIVGWPVAQKRPIKEIK